MKNIRLHSCFVTDVNVNSSEVVITDSMRCRWHVDVSDKNIRDGFKTWVNEVFLKGVAQTLTVFAYEERGTAPDIENWIIKFNNVQCQMVNG